MEGSYTASDIKQLQKAQSNVAEITKSRIPKAFARLHYSRQAHDVLPFQAYAARNRLFAKFETLIEELIETKPLLSDQLCSLCSRYNWTIAPGADDLRTNALREGYRKPDPRLGEGHGGENVAEIDGTVVNFLAEEGDPPAISENQTESDAEPVWLAETLPSGSLFQLLTRPECRICMLVLHLLSPLPIKSVLSWALDQPLSVLQAFCYSMRYEPGEVVVVSTKQPQSELWQDAGSIEMIREAKGDKSEQSLVWASSNLSRRRRLNSSWIHTTNIDYPLIKYWLRRCNEYHDRCHVNRATGRKDMELRLIDVTEQCLVPATLAHRYLALSYVWGGAARLRATKDNITALEQNDALRIRSGSLPRTVQDAMTFVARLGQRYLWVDSLCIIQDDQVEKHSQISNMHEIYSAAYATIVQHSGCDANAGLPGVRPESRSLLATKTHVGSAIMMAKANYATPKVLNSSVHSTRGWTHQEVILSNRCLHFFDKHLTFVCGEEWAQDWNTQYKDEDPSTQVIRTELIQVSSRMLWQMNPLSFTRVTSDHMWDPRTFEWLQYFEIYARILVEFTGRKLSFETDTLPAFYGLGGAITRLNRASFHFGMPSNSFDLSLLWINLGSGVRRNRKEGKTTPSWSWAAWTGQSTYNFFDPTGDPSPPYKVNSFVRHFYVVDQGRTVEIKRSDLGDEQYGTAREVTPYYKARQNVSEPSIDPIKASKWPDGCLHFWAEEVSMDQLHLRRLRSIHFLYHNTSDFCCGVLALPKNYKSSEGIAALSSLQFSLVLMSESYRVLNHWRFEAGGTRVKTQLAFADVSMRDFDHPDTYPDGGRRQEAWMFNVLLVKRTGMFVERIAFGQVHMLAWLEMRRTRRYVRMI